MSTRSWLLVCVATAPNTPYGTYVGHQHFSCSNVLRRSGVKTLKYDPPLYNTIRHADLYIPKVLFDPKTFVYLWNLFIWNFVPS